MEYIRGSEAPKCILHNQRKLLNNLFTGSKNQLFPVLLTNWFHVYRLFNILFWFWNIYEGAKVPSVYFIISAKC